MTINNIETIQEIYTADALRLIVIANALGVRDKYTAEHAQRVAIYAERIARRLGLAEEDVENIGIGGMLHDIGKIGFSDHIFTNF